MAMVVSIGSMAGPLHVDAHDALDEEMSEQDADERVHEHVVADGIREHRAEVGGIEEVANEPDQERRRRQDHAREPPLSRHRPHVARHLEALAYRVADVVEYLGDVTAA